MLCILFILIGALSSNVFALDVLDVGNLDQFSFEEDTDEGKDMVFKVEQPVEKDSFWNLIYTKYKSLIVAISGIITMTFVVFFIRNVLSFTINADNPTERKKAITGLLWTGIGLALTAGLTVYLGYIFYALR